MSKADLKLVGAPTTSRATGQARAALKAAIGEGEVARQDADEARAAVARAKQMVSDARRRLDTASSDVATAKDQQAKRVAAAATSGGALTSDKSMREARGRQVDAEDDLEAARTALAAVEAALEEPEGLEAMARKRVTEAARAVLAGEVEDALAAVVRAKAKLSEEIGKLAFLRSEAIDVMNVAEKDRLQSHLDSIYLDRTGSNPAYATWMAYFEVLKRDASATSPN